MRTTPVTAVTSLPPPPGAGGGAVGPARARPRGRRGPPGPGPGPRPGAGGRPRGPGGRRRASERAPPRGAPPAGAGRGRPQAALAKLAASRAQVREGAQLRKWMLAMLDAGATVEPGELVLDVVPRTDNPLTWARLAEVLDVDMLRWLRAHLGKRTSRQVHVRR